MMNIQQIRMDLRRNCSFNILLLVLYSHFLGFGQQVKLFVSDPVNAQLCQTAEAGSTLINTGTIDITNATLWLELPIGIEYVPGSVQGASELNISQLSRVQFQVDLLKALDSLKIQLSLSFKCSLLDQINQSISFSNKWAFYSMISADSASSLQPYKIATPFLVIQDVSPISTPTGSKLQRSIQITNSRLGSLESFFFEDHHDPIRIQSTNGNTIIETDQLLKLELTKTDFTKIGDRDSLFERDETIIITEQIEQTSCEVEKIQSKFNAYWSCFQDSCQKYEEYSFIDFFKPAQLAKLEFSSNTNYPNCICSDKGAIQELTIRNTGMQVADSIHIILRTTLNPSSQNPFGILRNSLKMSGASTILDTQFMEQVTLSTCQTSDGYAYVHLRMASLLPGQEAKIEFNYITCLACQIESNMFWYFSYEYESRCVQNSKQISVNNTREIINPSKNFTIDYTIKDAFGELSENKNYLIQSKFKFSKNISNQYLILNFALPCPIRLADTSFLLNGKSPVSKQILDDSSLIIQLTYAPPFNLDLLHEFPIYLDCDFLCKTKNQNFFNTLFLSSCPNQQQLITSLAAKICIFAQLSCPDREFDCGPCNIAVYNFDVECKKIPAHKDSIFAYLDGTIKTYRKNYGYADSDNDRIFESAPLDLSKVATKRFITGDTIVHEYFTRVVKDQSKYNYDSIVFLVSSNLSYDTVFTELEIIDSSTQINYKCSYPLFTNYQQPGGIPNCEYTIAARTGYGRGIMIPITPELLNTYGANLPNGFRFEQGDQIHAVIVGRIANYVGERILSIPINYRAFFIDRSHLTVDPFSCMHEIDTIIQASLGISFDQSSTNLLICNNYIELSRATIKGTKELNNFFPYEFRPFYGLDSFRIQINNNNILVDSIRLEFFYSDSSGNQLLFDKHFLARKRGAFWEIPPDTLANYQFDEAYTIRITPYAHVTDCKTFRDGSNTLISSYYINGIQQTKFYDINSISRFYEKILYSRANTLEIYNGNEQFSFSSKILFGSSGKISASALINNLKLPGGFEFKIISNNNSIKNIRLQINPGGQIDIIDSMHFRLIDLKPLQNYQLNILADFQACETDSLILLSRWFCEGQDIQLQDTCNLDTFIFILLPDLPELELDLNQLQKEVMLCDTLPEIELELYNADKGAAYDILLNYTLPPGIELAEALYSYPKGSPFKPLPTAILISPGLFRWTFANFIPQIQSNGLAGITEIPNNSILVKLKLLTSCQSVVNGFPEFEFKGFDACKRPTNSILKTGQLIKISGLEIPLKYSVNFRADSILNCVDEFPVYVNLFRNGITNPGDSIMIVIPEALEYVTNSLIPIKNFIQQNPIIIQENGYTVLHLKIPENIAARDSIQFVFKLKGLSKLQCQEFQIQLICFRNVETKCKSNQELCPVFIESGMNKQSFKLEAPSIELDRLHIYNSTDSLIQLLRLSFTLKNALLIHEDKLCFELYADFNSNQIIDSTDKGFFTVCINRDYFDRDSSYLFDSIPFESGFRSCNFILVTTNCLCRSDTISLHINQTIEQVYSFTICAGDSIFLGISPGPNAQYVWTQGTTDCDTCSQFVYHSNINLSQDSTLEWSLLESFPDQCNRIIHYKLNLRKLPENKVYYYEACPGEFIALDAGNRKNYKWEGASISDERAFQQLLPIWKDERILLHFKDEFSCPGTDSFYLKVLEDTNTIRFIGDSILFSGKAATFCVEGGIRYQWESNEFIDCPSCPCITIIPKNDFSLKVTVFDRFNCPHVFQITIKVVFPDCDSSTVFIPNAFSPNEDGHNDVLYVRGNNINHIHLIIYNRWGEKVFESNQLNVGWDGTYKNKKLSPDVFAYYLEVLCIGGRNYSKKGNISLLK
jgi:gliding motility-associated-like protein